MKKFKELVLYLIFGVLTTVVNFVVFSVFKAFTDPLIANIIAWIFAVIFAFVTNKFFVFESKSRSKDTVTKEFLTFTGARLFSLGVEEAGLVLMIKILKWSAPLGVFAEKCLDLTKAVNITMPSLVYEKFDGDIIIKLFLAVIVVVLNYVFSKLIIFKKKDSEYIIISERRGNMKKVSVIVPIYNVENYISKCLDSIVGQTYTNLEIICVDDGSPDRSADIVDSYLKKDSRIKLIKKENGGLSSARNEGIDAATGDYIVFVDSDDWLDLETIATAVETAERDCVDMVMWGYTREFKYRSIEKVIFESDRIFNKEETRTYVHRRIVGLIGSELAHPGNADSLGTAWGKLYNTTKIKDNNLKFVDTKIIGTEDVLFNTYYFGYVDNCKFINKPFNHYRKDNETSLTRSYKPQLFSQWSKLYDLMFEYIDTHADICNEDFKTALNNRICLSMIGLGMNEHCRKAKFLERAAEIDKILESDRYRQAYQNLDLSCFPPHWKLFFHYCKIGSATRTCLVLGAIHKIIDNRNQKS